MPVRFDRSLIPKAPDFSFELQLWESGVQRVVGIDEAGRGALAGPVAAGAIIFPANPALQNILVGVRDSKEMTPQQRAGWTARLPALALASAVGFASSLEIDELGIILAARIAIQRAIRTLALIPEHALVDYLELPEYNFPCTALVKGDARSLSISAASILAKTARDAHMQNLEQNYPGYGFERNKGYGTPQHRAAIACLGVSQIHRRSFNLLGGAD